MKKTKPARSKLPVLAQLCKLIPPHLVPRLAREHGIDRQARSFTPWSHVVSLLFAQLTHATGLNDACDNLRIHARWLGSLRGAVPPARNTFSHANKTRDSNMMEALSWRVLAHLDGLSPGGFGIRCKGLPRRFRRAVHAVDSSTISLVANCMDWARHRRRKAAAKLHLRLDLQSFLPGFVLVDAARHQDTTRAAALCAGLREGGIALFDKACTDFAHLHALTLRGVHWVTRAKENMAFTVRKKLLRKPKGRILRDDLVLLKAPGSRKRHPGLVRRVEMVVTVNGKETVMAFITNNTAWAASSVGDLYQARWGIEVFFKQIKQTLQLCDFPGHSKHAIRWQLWAALLLYVLMRFLGRAADWAHSFSRLVAITRGVVWSRFGILELLRCHGTAGGGLRMRASCETSYLPGLAP